MRLKEKNSLRARLQERNRFRAGHQDSQQFRTVHKKGIAVVTNCYGVMCPGKYQS